jgi:hypothetical protein
MESSSLKVIKIESSPTKRPETIKVIENGFIENSILVIESNSILDSRKFFIQYTIILSFYLKLKKPDGARN